MTNFWWIGLAVLIAVLLGWWMAGRNKEKR